ncbi:hypothetical protein PR048_030941 [Dryococelus australis]|uniref:Uncharacterized protein n=1 Tax=Dryococelus australis TaxID=614101 RepID=A0ABQ9GCW4_9NEOP|nr:hypothetical protein PR048_030941 [Dryococelus australis]
MWLTRFRFNIIHVQGKTNSVAETLRRMYDPSEFVVPHEVSDDPEVKAYYFVGKKVKGIVRVPKPLRPTI